MTKELQAHPHSESIAQISRRSCHALLAFPQTQIQYAAETRKSNQSETHLVKSRQQAHDSPLNLLLVQATTGAVHPHSVDGLDTRRHDAHGTGSSGDVSASGGSRSGGDHGSGARGRTEESGAEHCDWCCFGESSRSSDLASRKIRNSYSSKKKAKRNEKGAGWMVNWPVGRDGTGDVTMINFS